MPQETDQPARRSRRVTAQEFGQALAGAGILTQAELNRTRRIVIDSGSDALDAVTLWREEYGDAAVLDVALTLTGIQVRTVTPAGPYPGLMGGWLTQLAHDDPAAFTDQVRRLWPMGPGGRVEGVTETMHAVAEIWDHADVHARDAGYWLVGRSWYRRLRRAAGDTTDESTWLPQDTDRFLGLPVVIDDTSRELVLAFGGPDDPDTP